MEQGFSRLTVYFEDPFWVGLYERGDAAALEACKITFGREPTDAQVYELLPRLWRTLAFSPAVQARTDLRPVSPKRRQRQAAASLARPAGGTKAQQALQLQREQGKARRAQAKRARDRAEEARRFQLRQQKKKDRHRGR